MADVDALLKSLTPEQFEEWMDSDALDGTVSGMERLTWTVANGFSVVARREAYEIEAAALIPGETHDADGSGSGQSIAEQKAAVYQAAAIQNASQR